MIAELHDYIIKARGKNISDEDIKNQLINEGWQPELISAAFSQNSGQEFPIPPSVPHVGMWVGFLYILFFISLYVLAIAIAGIFNVMIDKLIPNALSSSPSYAVIPGVDLITGFLGLDTNSIVRGYLSELIVSFPVFLLLTLILGNQIVRHPMVKNLRSRKILIYITLIAAFIMILGSVITFSYDFLDGTITNNILGHIFVSILIAGSIFIYFIAEVIHDSKAE